jgi:hypothetical protein
MGGSLSGQTGKVIFSFNMWHDISKHKLIDETVDQLNLLKAKHSL